MPRLRIKLKLQYLVLVLIQLIVLSAAMVAPASATSQDQAIVNAAASQSGVAYCWDGGDTSGPTHGQGDLGNGGCGTGVVGFDCSGLALYAVYKGTGIALPHGQGMQSAGGQVITAQADLLPGDLVFFGGGSLANFNHVGVYAGNGVMWDANNFNVPVQQHTLAWETHDTSEGFDGGVRYWTSTVGSGGSSRPYAQNLVSNSGFNSGSNFNHWSIYPGTNYANYTTSSGIAPFEGDQYLATNAYQTGGSVYQDIPTTTSAGQDYCFSMMLTTADTSGGGGSGSVALLNMNSGTVVDAGVTNFSGLPNNSQWRRTEVCTPTTGAGNNLRVQLYPSVNGKTIGVDAATLNLDAAANGGFEQGSGSWSITQNTNYANYGANNPAAGGAQPYEGSHFEATNAYGANASLYQDIAISLSNGNEYCVNAMLTTADGGGASGGFGDLNLYAMNGGTVVSAGSTHFSGLPNNNQWVPVSACIYVTGAANTLRVQLYPGYGSPTLGVDAVNVNQDLVANGGFEAGTGWWSIYPGTNFTTYAANNGLTGSTNPSEGSNFGATNAYQAGGSIYQDIAIPTSAGQTYCVTAQLTTADQSGTAGGSGSLNLFNLNNGSVVNVGSTNFSNLPNNNQWRQIETCVDITGTGNDLRVQLYPTVNGKTLGMDAVNVL
ncbi:MAG TPA: NlpC/P60 family protein [Candidatus Saccharimonadales bacterium]|nr:NlpC/P60 family protein [Candidatus Saccharimonadales bacterium]